MTEAQKKARSEKRNPSDCGSLGGRPAARVEIGDINLTIEKIDSGVFSGREKLNSFLQENIAETLGAVDLLIRVNIARLNSAIKSAEAKRIDEAEKAYRSSLDMKQKTLISLMDKLEALENLRSEDQTGGKQVVFQINTPPNEFQVTPAREVSDWE